MQMAAIYTRVSSTQQREAHTIASQTAALVEWATTLHLEVPRGWVFEDDGYSGATLEGRRPPPPGGPRSTAGARG